MHFALSFRAAKKKKVLVMAREREEERLVGGRVPGIDH